MAASEPNLHAGRLAAIADNGMIAHVLNPVFPPGQNVIEVLAWLRQTPK